jgi:hypothetical protein
VGYWAGEEMGAISEVIGKVVGRVITRAKIVYQTIGGNMLGNERDSAMGRTVRICRVIP